MAAGKVSAGLLVFRRLGDGEPEVLLAHMGGPFWAGKDAGAWSIPKGEHGPDEDPLAAARREFAEELGQPPPEGETFDLGSVRQKAGKVVRAFAVAGDLDVSEIQSNTFAMEWPPRSGRVAEFPEVDRAQWFAIADAREKLVAAQVGLLDALVEALGSGGTQ
jgi:predicted NUDIX family NTP pyrophosphohydrolase